MYEKLFKYKIKRIKKRGERYKREYEAKEPYLEYLPEQKKRKVSNIMLVIIVVAIIGYTMASFWIQYVTGVAVDSTLTTCWYGFWTAEIIALATIKNSKTKHGEKLDEYNYDENEEVYG